jgi:hypothetical protein
MPKAAVFTTTASPLKQDDAAGVSMETNEPQTEEHITKRSRNDTFFSVSTLSNKIRNDGI